MKPYRLHLTIGLIATALLGALWAACAQDRPAWAPPVVLPPATSGGVPSVTKGSTPKYPFQAQPLPKKGKAADPELIVPAAVYETPKPTLGWVEMASDVVPASAQMPLPEFPPIIKPGPALTPSPAAPPLPAIVDSKPPAPLLIPEPTKALIIDPPGLSDKSLQPLPGPTPAPIMPTPLAPIAPQKKPEVIVTQPPSVTVINPLTQERVKSFLRLRSTPADPQPITPTVPSTVPGLSPNPLAPPSEPLTTAPSTPLPALDPSTLSRLQTPGVVVDKRGPASLRAGETQLYQIVIRNLSNVPAEQVRIEDELPAGVRVLSADPMPTMQGNRAVWQLDSVPIVGDQTMKLTLKADANVQLTSKLSVHVSAQTLSRRAGSAPGGPLTIRLTGPERIVVGKPAMFDIHVSNSMYQNLTGIILFGELPAELVMSVRDQFGAVREERKIEGPVEGISIAPGDFKILKMPTTAVKPGRGTVNVKVVTNQGEASASLTIDVGGETLLLQQAPTTRLAPGRDGDLRIELANHTDKALKNLTVSNLLPEGFSFVGASDRGLFQSNSRTIHWFLEQLPAGATKTLVARIQGAKAGQFPNHTSARADDFAEVRSTGTLVVEGGADLLLKVTGGDSVLELARETTYEVHVKNPGSAPATNVQVKVQFPPGLAPKSAQANAKFTLEGQSIVFEPLAALDSQGQAVFRVTAVGRTAGLDQRVRFSVVSDDVRTPLQREVSVMVYNAN